MIKWNEVTWYSRLGALILFLGIVPVLTFYIGTQYQLTIDTATISIPRNQQISLPKVQKIDSKQVSSLTSPDGRYVAKIYSTEEDTETSIVDQQGKEVVPNHPGSFISWLPDSKTILIFVSDNLSSDGKRHIFSLSTDGSYKDFGLPANTYDAAVSPYGSTTVYTLGTKEGSDAGDVYIRSVNGTDKLLVKGENNIFAHLKWLSKNQISFQKQGSLGNPLGTWVINLDGSGLSQLPTQQN